MSFYENEEERLSQLLAEADTADTFKHHIVRFDTGKCKNDIPVIELGEGGKVIKVTIPFFFKDLSLFNLFYTIIRYTEGEEFLLLDLKLMNELDANPLKKELKFCKHLYTFTGGKEKHVTPRTVKVYMTTGLSYFDTPLVYISYLTNTVILGPSWKGLKLNKNFETIFCLYFAVLIFSFDRSRFKFDKEVQQEYMEKYPMLKDVEKLYQDLMDFSDDGFLDELGEGYVKRYVKKRDDLVLDEAFPHMPVNMISFIRTFDELNGAVLEGGGYDYLLMKSKSILKSLKERIPVPAYINQSCYIAPFAEPDFSSISEETESVTKFTFGFRLYKDGADIGAIRKIDYDWDSENIRIELDDCEFIVKGVKNVERSSGRLGQTERDLAVDEEKVL